MFNMHNGGVEHTHVSHFIYGTFHGNRNVETYGTIGVYDNNTMK